MGYPHVTIPTMTRAGISGCIFEQIDHKPLILCTLNKTSPPPVNARYAVIYHGLSFLPLTAVLPARRLVLRSRAAQSPLMAVCEPTAPCFSTLNRASEPERLVPSGAH